MNQRDLIAHYEKPYRFWFCASERVMKSYAPLPDHKPDTKRNAAKLEAKYILESEGNLYRLTDLYAARNIQREILAMVENDYREVCEKLLEAKQAWLTWQFWRRYGGTPKITCDRFVSECDSRGFSWLTYTFQIGTSRKSFTSPISDYGNWECYERQALEYEILLTKIELGLIVPRGYMTDWLTGALIEKY